MALDGTMSSSLVEQWAVKSPMWADNLFSDSFLRDTDALTWALRKSLSSPSPAESQFQAQPIMVFSNSPADTPRSSSGSPEPPPPQVRAPAALPPSGRVSKRKSRATKRSPTTYINADPANFREMVQQVTGVRTPSGHPAATSAVLKPEPQRLGGRGRMMQQQGGGSLLPTLDTSAFLIGHHQQQAVDAMGYGSGEGKFSEVEGIPSFPTLESWRVK